MSELEDIKLKALLHEMKLESPDSNFSIRVMNKIFEENLVLEKIKSEKVLGKGFWIILVLFIVLLTLIVIFSNTGMQSESQLSNLLPEMNPGVTSSYQNIFDRIGAIPLSVVGILIASSTLLFIDKYITSNRKLFK